ncbi:MAG: imidazolonepropionase [Ignavibacteriales bacterium]|nr:imidazolonepropionase [Ignavibacteriales bacterium]
MVQLLLKNIRQLVTVSANGGLVKTGNGMSDLGIIENASVFIEDGTIRWTGPAHDFREKLRKDADVIEARDYVALPGFVDAHTHLLFAGSRENEFAMRARGMTYQHIAEMGGGILNTVKATRGTTKKELKKIAQKRLDAMMQQGTTTAEIKSGYGLNEDGEIKMLESIYELEKEHPMSLVPTFLGAHAIPPEYRDRPDNYVNEICERILPYIAKRNLARFCDVFCDRGYFTVDQARKILTKAKSLGLQLKIHADELSNIGASSLASELGATSAEHLEKIGLEEITRLQKAGTVAVLLPGVSFFLGHGYANARGLIDAGVAVAIASDFNPGSCMSFSMPLMMTIACTQMKMTPEEAISAATLNAAASLKLSDKLGSIEPGKQADIVLCEIPDYKYLAYHFGVNLISKVIKKGTILEFS